MKARAIVFVEAGRAEVREVEVPEPGDGEVLTETLYSVISPGTELRVFGGKQFPKAFPLVPGYANVGRVIATGAGVSVPVGTLVYTGGTTKCDVRLLWGGQVSHAVRPASMVHLAPDAIETVEAPLAKMAAIAFHGMRIAPPRPMENVAVVGLGVIGQLSARCYALHGARVVALDPLDFRVQVARRAGVDAAVPEGGLAAAAKKAFPEGVDILVDATGEPAVIRQLMPAAKQLPWDNSEHRPTRYVLQGSYVADFTVSYGDVFMAEMTMIAPRDCQARDIVAALELMRTGRLRVGDLITKVMTPEQAPEAYATLRDRKDQAMTIAFKWK